MTIAIKRETKYGEQIILLDDDDYKIIKQFRLPLRLIRDNTTKNKCKFYVEIRKTIHSKVYRGLLHRLIMSCPKDKVVDHINGNPLDNRKCNLRIATIQQNNCNKNPNPLLNNSETLSLASSIIEYSVGKFSSQFQSGIKGVRWHKASNKWTATLKVNKQSHYLGLFSQLEDAIKARKEAEKKYLSETTPP